MRILIQPTKRASTKWFPQREPAVDGTSQRIDERSQPPFPHHAREPDVSPAPWSMQEASL